MPVAAAGSEFVFGVTNVDEIMVANAGCAEWVVVRGFLIGWSPSGG
jgi:hypothetical protein